MFGCLGSLRLVCLPFELHLPAELLVSHAYSLKSTLVGAWVLLRYKLYFAAEIRIFRHRTQRRHVAAWRLPGDHPASLNLLHFALLQTLTIPHPGEVLGIRLLAVAPGYNLELFVERSLLMTITLTKHCLVLPTFYWKALRALPVRLPELFNFHGKGRRAYMKHRGQDTIQ